MNIYGGATNSGKLRHTWAIRKTFVLYCFRFCRINFHPVFRQYVLENELQHRLSIETKQHSDIKFLVKVSKNIKKNCHVVTLECFKN